MAMRNRFLGCALAACLLQVPLAMAEGPIFPPRVIERGPATLRLSAVYGGTLKPVASGLKWRVFDEAAQADGSHILVAESGEAAPALILAQGQYIVHAALGLASTTKRMVMSGNDVTDKLVLNAGGLAIIGMLGDTPIQANRLKLSIFVPERGNSEAKLVWADAKAGETLALPEGTYHIVSTYLDTVGVGALDGPDASNATNSIVSADLRVQAGKLVTASLRHKAAVLVLKLVNQPGAEALANTSFTVLTPGGDVIRELIGAFPSLVLAEGEYTAIARHDGKTYQTTFKVESTLDRDVEIIAKP